LIFRAPRHSFLKSSESIPPIVKMIIPAADRIQEHKMAAKEAARPYHRSERPENRPKDARPLPSHEITRPQKYSARSSAAIRTTSVKTWAGGGFSATNVRLRRSRDEPSRRKWEPKAKPGGPAAVDELGERRSPEDGQHAPLEIRNIDFCQKQKEQDADRPDHHIK
jgi:hypothetical protein